MGVAQAPRDVFVERVGELLDERPNKWLAEKTGIEVRKVGRLVRGAQRPDAEDLVRIADAFGVTVDQLVRGGE